MKHVYWLRTPEPIALSILYFELAVSHPAY